MNDRQAATAATFDAASPQPIKLVHSVREMKCFTVTESELQQIGLANLAMTGFFGIGSALFAFSVDIYKDVAMASQIPDAAKYLASVVQPMCFWFGLAFWAFSIAAWVWRSRMVSTIKREAKAG